jgi:nucleoside-diphosphate-sugar epimerase
MKKRIIITGATGMVGMGVLKYCLEDSRVSDVLSISRSKLGITHPMLSEIVVSDFKLLEEHSEQLKGYDACFFCLGTSSVSMTEADYTRITYDLTINFARLLIEKSPQSVFCYVSGEGTDSSEQGKSMWARVKGRTENELLKMDFPDAYMFRPGFIKALRGAKTKTKVYALFYVLLKPFLPLIMMSEKYATDTDRLAEAMIRTAVNGYPLKHLDTKLINKVAKM